MQESLEFDNSQKGFIELNILYKKLKHEISCLSNFVKEDRIKGEN